MPEFLPTTRISIFNEMPSTRLDVSEYSKTNLVVLKLNALACIVLYSMRERVTLLWSGGWIA